MQGSLVDKELYPRNDIDVYAVRKARQKIICKKLNFEIVFEIILSNGYKNNLKK